MKRILTLVLCIVMLTGVAGAGPEPTEEYTKKLERCVDYYNKHVEKVPKVLNPIIRDQTINVHILNDNKTVLVRGIQTKGVVVTKFKDKHFKKPDMDVYIEQSLIDRVLNKDDRSATKKRIKKELAAKDSGLAAFRAEYKEAYESGELKCVPHNTGAKIKMFVLQLLV